MFEFLLQPFHFVIRVNLGYLLVESDKDARFFHVYLAYLRACNYCLGPRVNSCISNFDTK